MQYLLLVVQLLPLIFQLVQQIEKAVPQAGAGKQKLDAVLGILQVSQDAAPAVTQAVSSVVTLLNAAKAWQVADK